MPRRKQKQKPEHSMRDLEFEISHRPSVDEVASIAIRRRIDELGSLERWVVSTLYGIGCSPMDVEEIAARLKLTVDAVWDLVDESVHQLGYRVVTELAA